MLNGFAADALFYSWKESHEEFSYMFIFNVRGIILQTILLQSLIAFVERYLTDSHDIYMYTCSSLYSSIEKSLYPTQQ